MFLRGSVLIVCLIIVAACSKKSRRPGRGGSPTGDVVGSVDVPAGRTINDLDVAPGRYRVHLDTSTQTIWLSGGEVYHFPAAFRSSAAPVTEPTARLVPTGPVLSIEVDMPPDRSWYSYKRTAPI